MLHDEAKILSQIHMTRPSLRADYIMTYIVCESVAWSLYCHVNFPREVGTNCDWLNNIYAKLMLIHQTLQRFQGQMTMFIRGEITVVFTEVWRINKKGRLTKGDCLIRCRMACRFGQKYSRFYSYSRLQTNSLYQQNSP
jgi:hypothetical protein